MGSNKGKNAIKAVIHYCLSCNHEWMSKKEEGICPECNEAYLDIEILR